MDKKDFHFKRGQGIGLVNKSLLFLLSKDTTNDFFNKEVKPKQYNTAIIGKKETLDFEALKKLGEIEEVTLKEIFNY